MKIDKKNNDQERRILIGMIVDPIVLSRITSKYQYQMFKSRWANIIAKWCISYYQKYEKAPLKNIESLFDAWSAETKDKNTVKLVGKFLETLNDEYEELESESNSDYIIDLAGQYFNKVKIEKLMEEVEEDISRGKTNEAHNRLISYNKIEMGVGEGINVLQDSDAMRKAFDMDRGETLIQFPGALGKFFMGALERECFLSFIGKKNVGKSFWLQTIAWEGLLQRRRVAFFEVGDMSENQTIRRLAIRAAKHPRVPCDVYYPTKIYRDDRDRIKRKFDLKEFNRKLSWQRAFKACQKIMQKKVKSKESYFKLSCHFNSTLSVDGIESILQDWERASGWIPDIIIIDYADILKMVYPGKEGRDCINETWKRMRALSLRRRCLLVTATQSDADSYDRGTLKMKNFSDDRRKIDSVTGMVGINQAEGEKKRGIMRLNWISLRDDEFHTSRCVHVAGCLALANPAIKSCF